MYHQNLGGLAGWDGVQGLVLVLWIPHLFTPFQALPALRADFTQLILLEVVLHPMHNPTHYPPQFQRKL